MIGEMIGQYRIIEKIGEGGMGVVYKAEQQQPKRYVALKVIRSGRYVDDSMLRMFEREIQSLALLKHPSIAGIYESGRTEEGQHFFAMELVEGETLSKWLQRRSGASITPAEVRFRLALFRKICDAVAYAHQRGVIHRDLKPSNILVIEREEDESGSSTDILPEVKILDFGLARITESDVAAASMVTEVGTILGTLQYMSPEQVRGVPEEIDIRTDVYALGVIFFEMLTGQLPYEIAETLLHEAVRVIIEVPPSTIAKTWSSTRRPNQDLEIISGKALAKDPSRRYQSATSLSEDVERYLIGQPILARPPSAVYQLRKMVQRHKLPFAFAAILVLLLISFAITTTIQANRIANERDRALNAESEAVEQRNQATAALTRAQEAEADALAQRDRAEVERSRATTAEQEALHQRDAAEDARADAETARAESDSVTGFLSTMLAQVSPGEEGKDVLLWEVLVSAAGRIEEQFGGQPRIETQLHETIGQIYQALGMYNKAESHLVRNIELNRELHGLESEEALTAVRNRANLFLMQQRLDDAESLLLKELSTLNNTLGVEDRRTQSAMSSLADLYTFNIVRDEEAERYNRQIYEIRQRTLGKEHSDTHSAMASLAGWLWSHDRYEEAESLFLELIDLRRSLYGERDHRTAFTMYELAFKYSAQGRFEEAEELYLKGIEIYRHLLLTNPSENLKAVNISQGMHSFFNYRNDLWEQMERLILDTCTREYGEEDPQTLMSMNSLASFFRQQWRYEEAEDLYQQVLEIQRRTLGEDHSSTLSTMNQLAFLFGSQERYEEAEQLRNKVLDFKLREFGEEHPSTLSTMTALAENYQALERFEEAESLLLKVLEIRRRTLSISHFNTLNAMGSLAKLYEAQRRYDEAERLHLERLNICRRFLGEEDRETGIAVTSLAYLYGISFQFNKLEQLLVETLDIRRRVFGPDHPESVPFMTDLARFYQFRGRPDEAEPLMNQALEIYRREKGNEAPETLSKIIDMATIYQAQGRTAEVASLARELGIILENIQLVRILDVTFLRKYGTLAPRLATQFEQLGRNLMRQEQYEEAEPLLTVCLEIRERILPENDRQRSNSQSYLGECLTGLGRYQEAETLLIDGYEGIQNDPGALQISVRRAVERLIQLYESWGKPDQVTEWRAKLPPG